MTITALELNDAGLVLRWTEGEDVVGPPPVPGCALWEDGAIHVGHEAAGRARLRPRHLHDRFWAELDTEPLPPPFPGELSAGDLAHQHLGHAWRDSGASHPALLLAVPGSFAPPQLGLLLGIAAALDLRVTGLVDAAVAASRAIARPGRCVHVDLELHRSVVTEIEIGDDLRRRRVQVASETGLARLRDAWARHVASRFVHQTRFDPLRGATSEQQLYDRLPELARELGRGPDARHELVLDAADGTVSAEIDGREVAEAGQPLVAALLHVVRTMLGSGHDAQVVITERVASVPGLPEALGALCGHEPDVLPTGAGAVGALEARELIETARDELPLVVRLPVAAERTRARRRPVPPSSPTGHRPTHVLHGGRATVIGTSPLLLGSDASASAGLRLAGLGVAGRHCRIVRRPDAVLVEELDTQPTFVNDHRVHGSARLAAGDRLRLGEPGVELQLVAVEEPRGPSAH